MAAPAAEHKDEAKAEPLEHKAGFYFASFTIQLFERKANGDLRREGSFAVRGTGTSRLRSLRSHGRQWTNRP